MPPTVLLAAVHGLAVLVKANTAGAVYRAAVAATAALAVGAFALSFVALRDLAVLAGIAPHLAVMLPLVIDLAVAVSTIALVAVGDKPAPRPRRAAPVPPAVAPRTTSPKPRTATSPRAETAPIAPSTAIETLAADLVAAKATRQPVGTVEAILEAHEKGDPLNRIAAALGVHHTAVKRVLEAAESRGRHLSGAA